MEDLASGLRQACPMREGFEVAGCFASRVHGMPDTQSQAAKQGMSPRDVLHNLALNRALRH